MPNDVRQTIAAEVRAEVARQKKTQRELGAVLEMDQASVWMRLNGKTPWRAEELVVLAQYFGVPVEQFLRTDAASAA
jgi:transcriptional regulator with XRE-family HTH domain